ncbi:MAG: HWE histidine kinase domain-containing protein, partial [Pseudomonadota bacterium]
QITLDERAAELFDLAANKPLPRELLHNRIHPEDREEVLAHIAQLFESEDHNEFSIQHRLLMPDGMARWLCVSKRVEYAGVSEGEGPKPVSGTLAVYDITDVKIAEERIQFLMKEVNHRAKNLLTVVDGIARMTARHGDPATFTERFSSRLTSLAANQDVLVQSDWRDINIAELVRAQMLPFADLYENRVRRSGELVTINAEAAQSIGMALHELTTNAAKYGALSNDTGTVNISWSMIGGSEPGFELVWEEAGGPPVSTPDSTGFGTRILKAMVESSLRGKVDLDYRPEGVFWRLHAPKANILPE